MQYDFVTQNYYRLIDENQAKFIFEQGEKHLKDQIDTSQQIATKTTTLLTVVAGLLIGLVGFALTRWAAVALDALILAAFAGSIYLLFIVRVLLKNLKPHIYNSVGVHPRDLFDDRVFNDRNKDYRLKAIYVNEIIECQKKIDINNETNKTRWRRFNSALRMVSYCPAVFFVLYLISRVLAPWLSTLHHYHL